MIEIPITKGAIALIDDEDYEKIKNHSWCWHGDGYAARGYHQNGRIVIEKMHHVIIGKAPKGMVVDHINGNKLDNRRCNLRFVTIQQNAFNSEKKTYNRQVSSQYKGVYWRRNRNKWTSYITVNGKKHYLGLFVNEKDAAEAYNKAAKRLHGEYAKLNQI